MSDAFSYDPRVKPFSIRLDVDNAIITLSGEVGNLKARRAAEQDARNTVGVWRVKNLLKVRPVSQSTDEYIARGVSLALLRDAVMDGYDINVKARNGVVTLTGTVDTNYEKVQADDIASRTNGVLNVKNNIAVRYPGLPYYDLSYEPDWNYTPYYSYWDGFHAPYYYSTWPYLTDREIKENIEENILWSAWLNHSDLDVKVNNGTATLTGKVNSWFEFNKASRCAYEGGAQKVNNDIVVERSKYK